MKRCIFYLFLLLAACNPPAEPTPEKTVGKTTPEQDLRQAIKQFPDSFILKENLVQFYRDSGLYDIALKEADQFILSDSINPRLWDIKAILHFENADTIAAIHAFEKAVSILPHPVIMIPLGTLYAQTKNISALRIADSLLLRHKKDTEKDALYIKGLYYAYKKEPVKAIAFFDKSLSINFTYMDAYREKAIALMDLGKYNDALAVLDKAVTLNNRFEEGYFYQGQCLEKLNRKEDAAEAYQAALMYDPNYIEAKEALAALDKR